MKSKTRRRITVKQTDEQIALTCTSAVQAYKISSNVHREYLKIYLEEAIKLGLVKEVTDRDIDKALGEIEEKSDEKN